VAPSGAVTNEGTIKVALGSTLEVIADSNGLVQTNGGAGPPVTQVDGTLEIPNGFELQAGLLKGTGMVRGNVDNTGGAVAPGDSPGILRIQGDYAQGAAGALDVLLAGLTPGAEYSQLDVTGNASLDGTIDVTKAASFNLALDDTFTVLGFGSLTGDFVSFDYDGVACSAGGADIWNCVGGVQFTEEFRSETSGSLGLDLVVTNPGATTVPEASTWAMLVLGLLGLGGLALRKRSLLPEARGVRNDRFTSILLKNSVSARRRLASWAAFGEAELALCASGGEDRRREGDELRQFP
jgi:hypothetical protein